MKIPWKPLVKWLIEQGAKWGISKIGNSAAPAAVKKAPSSKPRR